MPLRAILPAALLTLVSVLGANCPLRSSPGLLLAVAAVGPEQVTTWSRFETRGFVAGPFANPFDPAEVDLWGEFRAPDGSVHRSPGFATRDFTRRVENGRERLTPRGGLYFCVRFAPHEPGDWTWRWSVTTAAGSDATAWRALEVLAPAPGAHGFPRVSALDARYLRFDDDTPFLAIGENLGWYGAGGTADYETWFARLAEQGANYGRLWMPSWAFGIEWLVRDANGGVASTTLGDYTGRLDRAWQLDRVIEAAERHGIYLMLSIQNHGPFSLDTNSEWADNPYNAANGGPLAGPAELFTNEEARELFRRRLRYVVARWGGSPHVFVWELWNEVDAVPVGGGFRPEALDWHREMAQALRAFDPHDRLISSSTAFSNHPELYALPEMDFAQLHLYPLLDFNMAGVIAFAVPTLAGLGKPLLLSEFGIDFRGPAETRARDPEGVGFHDGLWAALLSGTFGTGMTWWWDNVIDPDDLYFHFGPVARAVEGIAFDEQGFAVERPAVAAAGRNLTAYALVGETAALAWVRDLDHDFFLPGPPVPVVGAVVTLPDVPAGDWTARWIDAYTGSDVAQAVVVSPGGDVALAVPTFTRDVALRVDRSAP